MARPFPDPRLRRLGAVLLLGLLCAPRAEAAPPRKAEAEDPYRLLDQLAQSLATIEREYFEPVDRAELLAGALTGVAAGLDPHSEYLDPAALRAFEEDTSGSFGGIGVEVEERDGQLVVVAPIEGSPAERAGVGPGDVLLAVDGQPLDTARLGALVTLLRGPVGSRVRVTIGPAGGGAPRELSLARERIELDAVVSSLLPQGIGYVRVRAFQEGTHEQLLEQLARLRREAGELDGLLLDLRNNPGGLVREAVGVADELLSAGVIYSALRRGEVVHVERARAGGAYSRGPLVVLQNEFSASAAELVAGALADHGRARLVGATSFGKGSVQTLLDLPGEAALKLTTALYATPSGRLLQARGVVPHVPVAAVPSEPPAGSVPRERDLRGHLAPGGRAEREPQAPAAPTPKSDGELHLGVARRVEGDPRGGPDRALAVAYGLLVGEAEKGQPSIAVPAQP
jgi:carboxyl-terminal processing protease